MLRKMSVPALALAMLAALLVPILMPWWPWWA